MGIQINGTTDTISAVDGSLDINQNATFGNNVTIGGTLTYEDVTNIDSLGIVTARNGLRIHAGGIDLTSGISTFSDNIQIADKIIHKDDTNTALRFPTADTFAVETAGSERLRIKSDGNVGIGTDNPQVKLTVSSTSPAVCDIHHIDGGTNDEARIILGALALNPPSNRGAGIAAVNNGAGHDLIVKCSASHSAGPTEKVRITSAGNFLVGKNSVYGSAIAQVHNTSQYVLDLNVWSADANPAVLAFYKSRNATPGSATVVQDDDGIGSLRFLGNDGANSREAAYIKSFVDATPGTNDMPGRLVFGTTADGGSSSTERLTIDKDGRVLLGAQRSFSGQGYYDDITINNSNSASGAAGGTGITMISGNNTWGALLFGDSDDDDVGYIKYAHNGDYMRFATGTQIKLRIDSDGLKFGGETAAQHGLDDYEEGEYIPTIVGSTSGSWTTANYRYLAYTKIGRMVQIQGYLQCDSESSPSGTLRISLPFAVGSLNDDAENAAITISMRAHGNTSTMYNVCGAVSGSILEIISVAGNGTHNWVDESDVGTSWNIRVGGCYIAT